MEKATSENQESDHHSGAVVEAPRIGASKSYITGWIALIGIALAVGYFYPHEQQQTRTLSLIQQSLENTEALDLNQQNRLQQFEVSQKEMQRAIQELHQKMNQLSTEKAHSTDPLGLLQEIANHVQLAQLVLDYDHDLKTAERLLQQAKDQIASLQKIPITPLYQSVQSLLDSLQQIKAVDVLQIFTQISDLQEKITALPLKEPVMKGVVQNAIETKSSTASSHEKGWWERFSETISEVFSKLVLVTHHDIEHQVVVTELEKPLLIQNEMLLLQEAKWAALQHESMVYQRALTQVSELLKQYDDLDAVLTKECLMTLQSLQSVNLTPVFPRCDSVLQLISLQIKELTTAATPVSGNSAPIKKEGAP